MTNTSTTNISGIKNLLRALRSRNYRLFLAGQSVSMVGTWMQQVAMSWLVYRITSSFLLGVVGFTSQIPAFLFSPVAGVLADRWNRRRLLIITQALAMLQAALLAAAVLSGAVQVWHIVVLSLLLGGRGSRRATSVSAMATRTLSGGSLFIFRQEKRWG